MTNPRRINLKGLGVSSGVAIGHARLFHVSTVDVGESILLEQNIEPEIDRFKNAVALTRVQIEELGKRVTERGEDKALSEVLTMHLLLLEDRMLIDRTIELVRESRFGAEYSLSCALKEVKKRYAGLPDLFRERFKDVEDIGRRIMNNLRGAHTQSLEHLEEESIIIARDLSPTDTASMRKDKVLGFAIEAGGKTSHTAILARALEIPAIVGVHNITKFVQDDDLIILDGQSGQIILEPSEEDLDESYKKQDLYQVRQSRLVEMGKLEPVTVDGHVIDLAANIEFTSEIESINKYGAHGVGLYRTEFLFLNNISIPSEEEQYSHYKEVAEKLYPDPVIIRTLDLGGDKFAHLLDTSDEMNPFLGCRAIRFCLENLEIFKIQLRAILRASSLRNIQIMYPLLSGCSELRAANELLQSLKDELRNDGVAFDENIPIGAMIEVPSAVIMAREMAEDLSFFSIGTNDLIQYTLAVDRGNEKIAHLYQPLHPAVLRMIANVVDVGREFSIPVDVCGEMASDPVCALMLMALGIERFSMAPHGIPTIKEIVRLTQMDRLREFGKELLKVSTVQESQLLVKQYISCLFSNNLDLLENLNESTALAYN